MDNIALKNLLLKAEKKIKEDGVKIDKDDIFLIENYIDIFENCPLPDLSITTFLLLINSYRKSQKNYKDGLNDLFKENRTRGIPELKQKAVNHAKYLSEILTYNGLMTKDASDLNDLLYNFLEDPDKYFIRKTDVKPKRDTIKEFFNQKYYERKSKKINDFIESLDFKIEQ
ncbi:hypothetical protein [Sulfurospirillum sp. 1612]|uniref:hypothetical protein n=1 Tax=Sulfurospirillum sp. 1612 TaxID=3094835 RepID=UPI002F927089